MKSGPPVPLLALLIAATILFWKLLERLLFPPKPPSADEIAAQNRELRHRLLNPDFSAIERKFDFMPPMLRVFYENTERLTQRNIAALADDGTSYAILRFLPADQKTLDDDWKPYYGNGRFPFAVDEKGNCYLVEVIGENQRRQKQLPVYASDSNFGNVTRIADSLEEFVMGIT